MIDCDRRQKRNNLQRFELGFTDAPTDNCLKTGESIEFMTSLVGVKSINSNQQDAKWDVLHTFRWKVSKTAADNFEASLVDSNVNTVQLPYSLMADMILGSLGSSAPGKVSTNIKLY